MNVLKYEIHLEITFHTIDMVKLAYTKRHMKLNMTSNTWLGNLLYIPSHPAPNPSQTPIPIQPWNNSKPSRTLIGIRIIKSQTLTL